MRIIGCDLHARQQTLPMLDTLTGEVVNRTLYELPSGMMSNKFQIRDLRQTHWKSYLEPGRGYR